MRLEFRLDQCRRDLHPWLDRMWWRSCSRTESRNELLVRRKSGRQLSGERPSGPPISGSNVTLSPLRASRLLCWFRNAERAFVKVISALVSLSQPLSASPHRQIKRRMLSCDARLCNRSVQLAFLLSAVNIYWYSLVQNPPRGRFKMLRFLALLLSIRPTRLLKVLLFLWPDRDQTFSIERPALCSFPHSY